MSRVTKLTLSIPEHVLKQAKTYAKQHKTSVSSIVTSLFRSLQAGKGRAQSSDVAQEAITTASVVGILSPSTKTKADLISEAVSSKYKKK